MLALLAKGEPNTRYPVARRSLWLLDVMVRRILFTSGIDDAMQLTSLTMAGVHRQRV